MYIRPVVHFMFKECQFTYRFCFRCMKIFLAQRDPRRNPVVKTRTCFLWENQYFQLDVYQQPSNERYEGVFTYRLKT